MGPIIILDKSALQAFSSDELKFLHECYLVNIVPVLLIEILGDLKKPSKTTMPKQKVIELANKIIPPNYAINTYFFDIIKGSLLGTNIPLRGFPVLSHRRPVKTDKGEHGIIYEEPPEEKALMRWRDGMTKLHYLMDHDRWSKRFQYEVQWKVYINGGALQEGSIPLDSIQFF